MMKQIATAVAAAALACASPAAQTYTGTITDDMCGKSHADMKMGTDDKCTIECVKTMGGKYALSDGKDVYVLSDQKTPAKFAGKKVTVTGTVDGKTLHVEKIEAAK
jgi:hypothetical protein